VFVVAIDSVGRRVVVADTAVSAIADGIVGFVARQFASVAVPSPQVADNRHFGRL
jgi:hypothetical protein